MVEGVGAEDYLEHKDKELAWLESTMPPLLEVPVYLHPVTVTLLQKS